MKNCRSECSGLFLERRRAPCWFPGKEIKQGLPRCSQVTQPKNLQAEEQLGNVHLYSLRGEHCLTHRSLAGLRSWEEGLCTFPPLWALSDHFPHVDITLFGTADTSTLVLDVMKPRNDNNHLCNTWWPCAKQLQGQWPMAFSRQAPQHPHASTHCWSCAHAPPAQLCLLSMKNTSKCQNDSQAHSNVCKQNTKRISWTVLSSVKDLLA